MSAALTEEELATIDALAAAATPGRWVAGANCVYIDTGHAVGDPDAPDSRLVSCGNEDARHIAAASPDVLRRLVAEVRRGREQAARMSELLRRAYTQDLSPEQLEWAREAAKRLLAEVLP